MQKTTNLFRLTPAQKKWMKQQDIIFLKRLQMQKELHPEDPLFQSSANQEAVAKAS